MKGDVDKWRHTNFFTILNNPLLIITHFSNFVTKLLNPSVTLFVDDCKGDVNKWRHHLRGEWNTVITMMILNASYMLERSFFKSICFCIPTIFLRHLHSNLSSQQNISLIKTCVVKSLFLNSDKDFCRPSPMRIPGSLCKAHVSDVLPRGACRGNRGCCRGVGGVTRRGGVTRLS